VSSISRSGCLRSSSLTDRQIRRARGPRLPDPDISGAPHRSSVSSTASLGAQEEALPQVLALAPAYRALFRRPSRDRGPAVAHHRPEQAAAVARSCPVRNEHRERRTEAQRVEIKRERRCHRTNKYERLARNGASDGCGIGGKVDIGGTADIHVLPTKDRLRSLSYRWTRTMSCGTLRPAGLGWWFGGLRQPKLDRGALAGTAPDLHRSSRLRGEAFNHREPQA
jgi:hypothetical protein